MNPSVHPATGSMHPPHSTSDADDDTVVTPPRGEKQKAREGLSVEKTLKFRFVPSTDNVHPAILHAQWLKEIKSLYGDGIQIFDNKNRPVTKIDPLRTDPERYGQQFQIYSDRHTTRNKGNKSDHQDTSRTTSYIVHRIQTTISLSEMKAAPTVLNLMKDHEFYVNEHKWSETDWETTQLGFFYGIDPQFYDADQATTTITKAIQQSQPRAKLPKFRLIYCSLKIRTAKGTTVRTKAYSIETQRNDRDEMTKLLKATYKESGKFVPFQMRARHPEAFEKFIKAQTHMIATNYTVILNHIGPDAMYYYLSERILAVPGVKLILPCHTVNEDGRYKILVHQKNYHRVREHLKEVLPHWYDTYVEPDAKVPDTRYPGKPKVSPIESDGFSQGDNTYMTVSINTAMSISSAISNDNPPSFVYPQERQFPADTSTLGGSRANSSSHGRSWADTIRKSNSSFSSPDLVSQVTILEQKPYTKIWQQVELKSQN